MTITAMMSTLLLVAMSEQTKAGIGAVGLAAGVAFIVGLFSVVLIQRIARRNRAAASWLAPIFVVATVGAGVLVSAQAMVLGSEQVAIMAAVLAVTATIAVVVGLTLAREVRRAEERHAEAEARRQRDAQIEAQRRELFSWMSHDLRSPLARMKVITEALNDDLAPDPVRYTRQLDQEVDALALLVDDLFALSRLTGPGSSTRRQRVDLADLASDALASCSPQASAAGIALAGSAEPGTVVAADPTDLHRALHNLLDNALRHTRAGGTVRLTCDHRGAWAQLAVADECGGIPDEALRHVFEPGWRGDEARSPGEHAGFGLGLAIVRRAAQQQGGGVSVRNEADGCVFTLRLPLAGADPRAEAAAAARDRNA
jgi:signal transduction histidine kinase